MFMYKIIDEDNEIFWDETIMQLKPIIHLAKQNKRGIFKFREYELDITDCETELEIFEMKNNTQVQFTHDELVKITRNKKCIRNFDSYLGGDWSTEFIIYFELKLESCRNQT